MKTSDLIGPALDWAVAKCEEDAGHLSFDVYNGGLAYFKNQHLYCGEGWFRPSTDWSQGGTIIEREGINTFRYNKLVEAAPWVWAAHKVIPRKAMDGMEYSAAITLEGPTPLIAAMRCYVASKLGNKTKVPNELL